MSDPDNLNPYQSPATESKSPQSGKNKSTYASVIWLFVLPFLFAHIVYWPIFLFGVYAFGNYGIIGLFLGTGALLIAGAGYGVWLGFKIGAESLSVPSLHPALYGLGQTLWFLFSVIAPCSCAAFAVGM